MADLYALLGVARDADAAAIRRAYRQAAKSAHPDGGGTREDFAALKFAYECLVDPERRRRYDETGDSGREEVDNLDAFALQHAMNAIGNLIGFYDAQPYGGVEQVDLYAEAAKELGRKAKEFRKQVENMRKQAEKQRAFAARSRARDGLDRIAPMFEAQARACDEGARQNETTVRQIERAIEILGEHEFVFDKAKPQPSQPRYGFAGLSQFRIGT